MTGSTATADPAVVVVEVMLALGLRGHTVAVTPENGPALSVLAGLMLRQFGIDPAQSSGRSSGGTT